MLIVINLSSILIKLLSFSYMQFGSLQSFFDMIGHSVSFDFKLSISIKIGMGLLEPVIVNFEGSAFWKDITSIPQMKILMKIDLLIENPAEPIPSILMT